MSLLSSEYRLQGFSLSGYVLCHREMGETHESERIQQRRSQRFPGVINQTNEINETDEINDI